MSNFNFKLDTIKISKIEPSHNNPRGKNIRESDKEFNYLKKSISEFGLLVPLVVRPKNRDKYYLIDGERRLLALRELGILEAPAHVLRSKINNNVAKRVMFHIHTNRLQWEAFQQCIALEPIYQDLKRKYNNDESKIANDLVKHTSTHKRTINDRLNFLRWPLDLKNFVYEKENDRYWTVVEIEKGFIKPAVANFPKYFKRVSIDKVRRLLLEKFLEGYVHAAIEVRKVKAVVQTSSQDKDQHGYASEIIKDLVNKKSYTFEEGMYDFQTRYPHPQSSQKNILKKIINQMISLKEILEEYDFSQFNTSPKKQREAFLEIIDDLDIQIDILKEQYAEIFNGS